MNYIGQMNGFRRWRREHALPSLAQLLWYTLTTEQNQRIWPEEFEMSTSVLRQQMGGISVNAFRRARNALVRAGLLQATMQQFINSLSKEVQKLSSAGYHPILLTSPASRLYVRKLTERIAPNLVILSFAELENQVEIQSLGMVKV